MKQTNRSISVFLYIILCIIGMFSFAIIPGAKAGDWAPPEGYTKYSASAGIVTLTNPSSLNVDFYLPSISPDTPPMPGAAVLVNLTGNSDPDIQLLFDAAAGGKTVYIEFEGTSLSYIAPNSDETFDWAAEKAADPDQDGVPNNSDPDDDNDGLSDLEESLLGTFGANKDSDGDGLEDSLYSSGPGQGPLQRGLSAHPHPFQPDLRHAARPE